MAQSRSPMSGQSFRSRLSNPAATSRRYAAITLPGTSWATANPRAGYLMIRCRSPVSMSMTSLSSPIDFRYSSKLHVRLGYQHHRGDGHPGGGKRPAGELDVLPGVNGTRFNDDRVLGDTERHRVLGVVNGLAAREAGRRRRAVPAREHQHGEQADVVQVRGEPRDSEVVAAQPDTRRARAELTVHLMVVPDEPGVGAVLVGGGVAGVHAVLSCRGSPRKPGCGDWLASDRASRRMVWMARSRWDSPHRCASWAVFSSRARPWLRVAVSVSRIWACAVESRTFCIGSRRRRCHRLCR